MPNIIGGRGPSSLVCEQPLPCGSENGAECCTEGQACPGSNNQSPVFSQLTCVNGTCEGCGVPSFVPCDGVAQLQYCGGAWGACNKFCLVWVHWLRIASKEGHVAEITTIVPRPCLLW